MNTLLRAAVAVATVALVGAVPASAQGVPEGATQAMVDKGNEIYHKAGLCYACHGQDGARAWSAPNLIDDVWIHNKGPSRIAPDRQGRHQRRVEDRRSDAGQGWLEHFR
jgi:mono/diheme cytochrome c family protein